jgi:hypothetical protein
VFSTKEAGAETVLGSAAIAQVRSALGRTSTTRTPPAVEVLDLKCSFGKACALDGLSLCIETGTVAGIVLARAWRRA